MTMKKKKLSSAYQQGLKYVPPEIMDILGKDAENVPVIKGDPKDNPLNAAAEYKDGHIIIYDTQGYESDPGQTTGHELDHMAQERLPKSVQSKFPEIDENNRYGQAYTATADDFQQLRKQGKTMADFSEEVQAGMVQRFIFESQYLNDKRLTPEWKARYQKDIEAIKPFIHDYVAMSKVKDRSMTDRISSFLGGILPK